MVILQGPVGDGLALPRFGSVQQGRVDAARTHHFKTQRQTKLWKNGESFDFLGNRKQLFTYMLRLLRHMSVLMYCRTRIAALTELQSSIGRTITF